MEALLWHELPGGAVRCELCYHRCRIEEGGRGLCCVRENRGGRLYSLSWGRLISANLDPIEKKPLFHFHPGSRSLSIATVGCNFRCQFCQNWSISQWPRGRPGEALPGELTPPDKIAELAAAKGAASISYTYTEPTVFWEYVLDVAREARARGVKNVLVTNGYMTPQALDALGNDLDAANVDLKGASSEAIQRVTSGRPGPVRANIRRLWERGIWVEVTTLIVPGLNDTERDLRSIASFLASVSPSIPWHVSRFHPDHEMQDRPATPPDILRKACEWGRAEGLGHVYTGNLWGDDHESTRCAACGEELISRRGFRLLGVSLKGGRCPRCGAALAGVGLP
jgi:pyruvate formate lyase activating enzyme